MDSVSSDEAAVKCAGSTLKDVITAAAWLSWPFKEETPSINVFVNFEVEEGEQQISWATWLWDVGYGGKSGAWIVGCMFFVM